MSLSPLRWYRTFWFRHYYRKYIEGQRTSYGAIYSFADLISEAQHNPLCPRTVARALWNRHSEDLAREE